MTDVLTVVHLVGSPTDALYDDLSRLYAAGCLAEVQDPARYDHRVVHVAPDGAWRLPADLSPAALAAAPALGVGEGVAALLALRPDVAVPQMFCRTGMTGYRALLDVLGIPFVGNTAAAMALTADKAQARAVVAAAGVAVPEGEVLLPGERPSLAPPLVVKPVDADNSLGVSLVRTTGELDAALEAAFAHGDRVLVERYVEAGREVRCGIVERDGVPVALPLEEYAVDPVRKPVRGADDKLARSTGGDLRLVAKDAEHAWVVDPDDPVTARVQALALVCHRALGCRDHSLVDVRVDPSGTPWFLEAGLYCSYARASVVPTMARAVGLELPELFAEGVAAALARGQSVSTV